MDFRLLGPVEVWSQGRRLKLPAGKQRGLLALLLLHANRAMSRDAIIDGLWEGEPPASVRHTVEVYVSRLRKALAAGDATVETLPNGYRLRIAPERLDVARFEALVAAAREARDRGDIALESDALREALAVWRGDALADVKDLPFAQLEASRLEDLRLGALEDRIEADIALERHASVVSELGALVKRHPERERLCRALMLALYGCGRQQEALDVYAAWRRNLRDRLGLEPSPETRKLERRILTHDPTLGQSPEEPPTFGASDDAALAIPAAVGRTSSFPGSRRMVTAVAVAAVVGLLAVIVFRPESGSTSDAAQRGLTRHLSAYSIADVLRPSIQPIDVGGPVSAMASGFGALWVATTGDDVVARVDPRRGAIAQTVPTGRDPIAVATGFRSVWVASADGTVTEVNPTTNLPSRSIRVGGHPDAICAYARAVWVTEPGPVFGGTLIRIEPASGAIRRFPLGGEPAGVIGAFGSLWVSQSAAATVARITPTDPAETPRIVHTADGPAALAVGAGAIWVANTDAASVGEINPRTNSVTSTFPLAGGPRAVGFGGGRLWAATPTAHKLYTIDPETGRLTTIATTRSPSSIATLGADTWVGDSSSPTSHVGGTLTAAFHVTAPPFFSVDPANADISLPVTTLTNDGLLSYREAPGAAGNTLAPDLATTLPSMTPDGRTYVFHLRRGIHYSTGQPVRPQDFRFALQRAYRIPGAGVTDQPDIGYRSNFDALPGARACQARPRHCDLSRAIVTNNKAHTITIHLTRRDPEFLYAMATGVADLLPPGTPLHGVVPATGPYEILHASKSRIALVRNPYFHAWSSSARRSSGFADRIILTKASEAAALRGTVDLDVADKPSNSLADLAREHPRQTLALVDPAEWWMTPNTHEPPFTSPLARRAVNVALNSAALAAAQPGGTVFWQPTCHILSTRLLPYPHPCPIAGSTIALARRLVAESGTGGMRVVVWSFNYYPQFAQYFARLLDEIGYRATATISPSPNVYFAHVMDSRSKTQISLQTWNWGDPTGALLIRLFGCKWYFPANPNINNNSSEFCNPTVDRQMAAAAGHDANPTMAWPLWARIDNSLVHQGAVVPGLTPRSIAFLSHRIGNLATNWNGLMLDQAWVR